MVRVTLVHSDSIPESSVKTQETEKESNKNLKYPFPINQGRIKRWKQEIKMPEKTKLAFYEASLVYSSQTHFLNVACY